MFCPSCGTQERELSQFCRACGGDLRSVRAGLDGPSPSSQAATNAREEIGLAVAARIREVKTTKELSKVVESVLPEVQKFLETEEAQRLRRMRTGSTMAAIGLGISIFFVFVSVMEQQALPMIGIGILLFLIGLVMFVNGRYFTVPNEKQHDEARRSLREAIDWPRIEDGRQSVLPSAYAEAPPSVVEVTTRELQPSTVAARPRNTAE